MALVGKELTVAPPPIVPGYYRARVKTLLAFDVEFAILHALFE